LTPIHKWLIGLLLLFSFVGFLDATYLTVQHFLGSSINCSIFEGCNEVITSRYASIAGIPVALLGALYYCTLFISLIAYCDTRNERILYFIAHFVFIGFFASIWFLFLQLFIIKAICFYCVISAVTSTMLFVFGILLSKFKKKENK